MRHLPALTPEHAIALLRLLSTDLREVAVLDASGTLLAGDPGLAGPAAALLARAGEGTPDALSVRDGDVLLAAGTRHAVAVRTGPKVLAGLLLTDLHGVLADLA